MSKLAVLDRHALTIVIVNMLPSWRAAAYRISSITCVSIALLVLPSLGHAASPAASRYYEDALQRFERKDYAGAVLQLKNAIQIDRKMLPVHVLLGRALLANGEFSAAEAALSEAIQLGVNRSEVVLPLARAIVAQGRQGQMFDQPHFAISGLPPKTQAKLLLLRAGASSDVGDARAALKAIEESRALDPSSPESWLAEVPIRIRSQQLKEASAAAARAVQMAPGLAEAHYVLGTVHHSSGALQPALAAYDKALSLDANHEEALVSRAGLLIDLKRLPDARRDAEKLKIVSPTDPRGAYLRALLDEAAGNTAAARESLNEVTNLLDPVPMEYFRYRPQVLMLGGLAHFSLNQREKAKPYLEGVQRTQPGSPVAKVLAQIHLSDKNYDRAIESLDSYLRTHPNDTQASLLLASAHFAQGRHARAAQLTGDALKRTDTPELRTMLGISFVGTGKIGDAVKEFEASFSKDPKQLQAGVALATIYLYSGQAAKAVATASKLAQHHPQNAGVQNLLGNAQARAKNASMARAAFDKAIKLDPAFAAPQLGLARLDIQANNMQAAVSRLSAILAKDSKHVETLIETAQLHERLGRAADAQRLLESAADHSSANDLQPALLLVDFHLRQGHADAARAATARLTSKAPEAIPVLVAVARVALATGDANGARSNLSRAARMAGFDGSVLLQIATLQLSAGAIVDAGHTLSKVLSERPDFTPAQALMTEVELRQGEMGKAEVRARQIAAKHPKAGIGHALLGDVATARGHVAVAIDHYRRAHLLEQSSESVLRLYRAQAASDPSAAAATAEQWLKTKPGDLVVRRSLGDAQARSGNLAAARASYEAVLRSSPNDPEVLNNLANVLVLLKDPTASAVADRALAQRPQSPHIIGTAGWAAFKAGQNDKALQLLRDARLRDPGNPDTRYFLGTVLAAIGRQAEAREELQGALALGPKFDHARDAERLLASLK